MHLILSTKAPWITMPWYIPLIAFIILFVIGFIIGWIRGGPTAMYFFLVNIAALLLFMGLFGPFRSSLMQHVSIKKLHTYLILRALGPTILAVVVLLPINIIAWVCYRIWLRKRLKAWRDKLSKPRRRLFRSIGAMVGGFMWVFFGMLPVYSAMPVMWNYNNEHKGHKPLKETGIYRIMDTLYYPFPMYKDLNFIESSKETFMKSLGDVQKSWKAGSTPLDKVESSFIAFLGMFKNEQIFGDLDVNTEKQIDALVDKTKELFKALVVYSSLQLSELLEKKEVKNTMNTIIDLMKTQVGITIPIKTETLTGWIASGLKALGYHDKPAAPKAGTKPNLAQPK